MVTKILRAFLPQCPEHIWPEMRFPSCRCTRVRWHAGAHRDHDGDTWEGKRR